MRAAALAAAAALLAPEVAAQNCQPWQHTQKVGARHCSFTDGYTSCGTAETPRLVARSSILSCRRCRTLPTRRCSSTRT